jgi:protein TonB
MKITIVVGLFVIGLAAIIGLLRWWLTKEEQALQQRAVQLPVWVKKYATVDVRHYRYLLVLVGWLFSLGALLTAFEWTSERESDLADEWTPTPIDVQWDMMVEINENPEPPAPQTITTSAEHTSPQVQLDAQLHQLASQLALQPTPIPDPIPTAPTADDETPTNVASTTLSRFTVRDVVAAEAAMPKGGYEAFYRYLSRNVRYPLAAKQAGIEGRLSVQCVVNTDGTLTDFRLLNSLGNGCDEEALRVLKAALPWIPARQNGKAVRQTIVVPIIFQLH